MGHRRKAHTASPGRLLLKGTLRLQLFLPDKTPVRHRREPLRRGNSTYHWPSQVHLTLGPVCSWPKSLVPWEPKQARQFFMISGTSLHPRPNHHCLESHISLADGAHFSDVWMPNIQSDEPIMHRSTNGVSPLWTVGVTCFTTRTLLPALFIPKGRPCVGCVG